jgi:thiosulfate dehydrogenase
MMRRTIGSLVLSFAALSACGRANETAVEVPVAASSKSPVLAAFRVPEIEEITDSAMRRSALRGRAILEATRDSLPHNVGNLLRCTSCHFAAGTVADAMPWVGVYSRFPQYRPRSGRVDILEDRINDCFERSMNGTRLREDSREMRDIVAYMAFLSLGVPAGSSVTGQSIPKLEKLHGDTARGALVFSSVCSRCHGVAGEGSAAPPLWGKNSYNNGAGMSRLSVFAAFAKKLMPFDKPGTLTPQQAYDVAAYVNSRPRPDFPARARDFPAGNRPDDIGYPIKRGASHLSTR